MKEAKPRVVLDTSTIVSALIGGVSGEILELWRGNRFDVIISEDIVEEYAKVLKRPKFDFSPRAIEKALDYVRRKGIWVTPRKKLEVIREDPDDNKFLEAALEGKADYILSGDKHLLALGEFEGIPIIGSREFLEILKLARA